MTLNDYFILHGTKGLRALADAADTKLSYLLQLNHNPEKRPSMEMAQRLVDASMRLHGPDGALTYDGLAKPKKVLVRDARKAVAA